MSPFETPLIWTPETEDWESELNRMLERSEVTSDLIAGKIDPEYFLDFLAQQEFDVQSFLDGWEDELSS